MPIQFNGSSKIQEAKQRLISQRVRQMRFEKNGVIVPPTIPPHILKRDPHLLKFNRNSLTLKELGLTHIPVSEFNTRETKREISIALKKFPEVLQKQIDEALLICLKAQVLGVHPMYLDASDIEY